MRLFISIAAVMLVSLSGYSQDAAMRTKQYNLEKGLAIQGYDPVSYFQGKAARGSKDHAVSNQGVTYYFVSAANAETFKKNPAAYEPQYGGWCAYAMGAKGEKVSIDPKTYKITDGKLFLFYNRFFNNTLEDWNENEKGLKQKADANWQKKFSK
jgi:YHS domain-containing protein